MVSFKEKWTPAATWVEDQQCFYIWGEGDTGENRWKQTNDRNEQSLRTETAQLKQNNPTKQETLHTDTTTGPWHPAMPMWILWMLMAQTIVRLCSINILIFAFLLQTQRETCSAGNNGFQNGIQRLQLCEEDNDGEWSADKRLDKRLLAFQKKDCSLAGVVSIQSDTMVIF